MILRQPSPKRLVFGSLAFLSMIGLWFGGPGLILAGSDVAQAAQLQQRSAKRRRAPASTAKTARYARFSHSSHVATLKLACDSCHKFPSTNWKEVRKGDEAFPDVTEYPHHETCLGCHRQQFFARERPVPQICQNCHVNGTPVDTSRYPFPSLGEKFLSSAKAADFFSDFRVNFPHEKHLDVISATPRKPLEEAGLFVNASFGRRPVTQDSDPKMCAVCHQTLEPQGKTSVEYMSPPPKELGDAFWLKRGTFKTRPTTHAACFTCHNAESEVAPLPKNCDACHKLQALKEPPADFDPQLAKQIGIGNWSSLNAWSHRFSAGTFRHEAHVDLSCTKCHSAGMNTVEFSTLKVPVSSCGGAEGCHVSATTDDGGILNYEIDQRKAKPDFVCSKCHIVFGQKPVPASHVEIVGKAAAK